MSLYAHTIETPLGEMSALFSPTGLRRIDFSDRTGIRRRTEDAAAAPVGQPDRQTRQHLRALESQLTAYFQGQLTRFEMALDWRGTEFQLRVWGALRDIPLGETRSYAALARQLGIPRSVRAVAGANARNPLAIVVPCHRLLGSDGSLRGYAGGLWRKQALLTLEKRVTGSSQNGTVQPLIAGLEARD